MGFLRKKGSRGDEKYRKEKFFLLTAIGLLAVNADSDLQLIERCSRGEAAAWVALVERYTRLVYSVPRKYGLSSADCDDIHQAVFAALVSSISKLKNPQALPAWLITATHRECWRIGRAR